MKIRILLSLFSCLLITEAGAFSIDKFHFSNAKQQESATSKDQISGKRWKLSAYKKGGQAITFKYQDFIWFRAGGAYEAAFQLVWESGSWQLDKEKKEITTSTKIGGSKIWKFSWKMIENNGMLLILTQGNEEIQLLPGEEIRTDVVLTGIKKELSGTWKINEHVKNKLNMITKPQDFIRLHPDGHYEHCLFARYLLAKWSVDEEGKKLTMNGQVWIIESLKNGILHLKSENGKETMVLAKK